MLLDNKTQTDGILLKMVDFLKKNTEQGLLDLVTGFFSINALAMMHNELGNAEKFRFVLGNLIQDEKEISKVINLLNSDAGIESTLSLSLSAQKAVEFLKQDKVAIKTVQKNFCHAKAYIYKDRDERKNYHIIGSSNLTDAGLGMRKSANIELNAASTGNSNDWQEVRRWFENLWENTALEKIETPDKIKKSVKHYIIELISNLFKQYTPKDLYYKALYELFKDDLLSFSADADFNKEIKHLSETVIYRTLYPYQQSGVISLIKMLQKYNGAILADAVGLGKTWTALAVMKYFHSKGYSVIVFCPKKLENNWMQYQSKNLKFAKDEIEYIVRYHSDLQDERLEAARYHDFSLSKIQRKQKLLVVIDESHNLRNDKSSRYKYLVEHILQPEKTSRDVKVLQLSATPINNKLLDIRNQFKLIIKGQDNGFKHTNLDINSLGDVFRKAQADYTNWCKKPNRKITDFISQLSEKFFRLTDALIVARTRKLIENEFGAMNFPKKEKPVNEYITPENIGNLKSFDEILEATEIDMTAYRPSEYIKGRKDAENILKDEVAREGFLVKMMQILMIKRLESSWYSFKLTVEKILNHHAKALDKVNQFIKHPNKEEIVEDFSEEEQEELEDTASEIDFEKEFILGKKNPVKLSEITDIKTFQKNLERDVNKLRKLKENLDKFEAKFKSDNSVDIKLTRLIDIVAEKQKQKNKKMLIFTVYKDTAEFLYREISKRNLGKTAFVSGSRSEMNGYSGKKFEPILERFAPYTKLYNEKDWTELYEKNLDFETYFDGKWNVPYEKWIELVKAYDEDTTFLIEDKIDILVATDCLSEGQNLQDCDMVINYDIHWNPVRLIQRMGRIDRLGSLNETICGINFWPAQNFENYLKLKNRIEARMIAMTLIGSEIDENITDTNSEDNPLFSEQTQKMLKQMQLTWDDIEDNDETLGLNDLSLEQFRQELFEFFRKNEEFFKQMPNGVFTGFKFCPNKKHAYMADSIVAVLGYPRRAEDAKDNAYSEIHILHQPINASSSSSILQNRQEILNLLRYHKEESRYVPSRIEKNNPDELKKLSKAIGDWLKVQAAPTAISEIQNLFSNIENIKTISPERQKLEEKFKAENFDLITWFIITK
ncbi:MAG: DEAD/DEAH box helicase family protein [Campylobacteraceae bacterium]|jgi:superfamily II DNA or RNA helicase|nr:DEAD/DEAH box helicase family protein [Campylobacteraceae bacterium]